jgi:Arc/MetJ-type ribon-helix-helix transcriptional regulator
LEERKFRSISLNNELVEQIEHFIKENAEYRSVADFVTEATRLRLQVLTAVRNKVKEA